MGRAAEEVAALHWQHHPQLCLLQVPKIMRCIRGNREHINMESARQSVESLLLLLANRKPITVLTSLLKVSSPAQRYCHKSHEGLLCEEQGPPFHHLLWG